MKSNSKPTLQLESLEPRVLLNGGQFYPSASVVYDIDPEEQLFIYLLNLARSDPEGYAIDEGFSESLSGINPQPPLAVNSILVTSSGFHAEEMATYDYFGHTSQVTGDQPNKMAIDAGYPLPWGPNGNQIESIAAGYGNPPVGVAPTDAAKALQVLLEDIGLVPPGHRQHLLGMPGWDTHREIGAGWDYNGSSTYKNYWAIHTAYENTSDQFLTGVVYNDKNNNDRYDANEGLSGVTVSTTSGSTQTNSAGGWTIPITDGDYIVSATGDSFSGTGSAAVRVDGANMEIDFISGEAAGVVNFGVEGGSGFPEVSVTATDAQAAEAGPDTGTFTFTRTGATDNPMTINYTVAGTATSGTDYQTIATSVIIPASQSSTTVTITPIDDDITEGQETVLVSLQASLDYNFGSSASATVNISDNEGVVVNFVDGIVKAVSYTEPDGTTATISLKSANGSVVFQGDGISASDPQRGVVVVSGGLGATIADITLDNTGSATSLSFKASGGDGYILVDNININGSAKDIKGKQINLGGNLTVNGGLAKLELHNVADQHLITIGQSTEVPGPVSMKFNEITDLSIDSDTAIKSLACANWTDNDATLDTIEAPWLGKITSQQKFPASMTLTDDSVALTLGSVKVTNEITGGLWLVNGHGGKITANAISGIWAAVYTGNLAGLSTKQDATGNLTANTIKNISVKGNYIDGSITLTQSSNPQTTVMSKLSVTGTMDNIDVRSQANLGSVTAGRILNSNLFAGVDNAVTQLPTSATDFSAGVAIKSVTLKGIAGQAIWLQNSNIAASELGKVAAGFAQTDNSGVQFGIATQQFKSIAYKDATNNLKAKSAADLAFFTGMGDLVVRVLS
ncbi:MAG: hypothetical protein JXD22_17045 [Sedimentisphaerales bacterium]|nr:hypothetical protein [Sedimentisphaerales bacterium]